jgi:hypothetical protein
LIHCFFLFLVSLFCRQYPNETRRLNKYFFGKNKKVGENLKKMKHAKIKEIDKDCKEKFTLITSPTSPSQPLVILTNVTPNSKLGRNIIQDESKPTAASDGIDGWQFINPGTRLDGSPSNKINWYYYINPVTANGTGPQSPTTTTYEQITANWAVINFKGTTCTSPQTVFFIIYSELQSSNNAGSFYHSRATYSVIPQNVLCGQEALYYVGVNPITIHPELPHIAATNLTFTTVDPLTPTNFAPTEVIRLLNLSTASGAPVNSVNISVYSFGATVGSNHSVIDFNLLYNLAGDRVPLAPFDELASTTLTINVYLNNLNESRKPFLICANSLVQFTISVKNSNLVDFLLLSIRPDEKKKEHKCKQKQEHKCDETEIVIKLDSAGVYTSGILLSPEKPGRYLLTVGSRAPLTPCFAKVDELSIVVEGPRPPYPLL